MASFENKYNISKIVLNKKIHNLCTIGQDWFTNNIQIEMVPIKTIPDYIEIDNMLATFEGKELVIEEVVYGILEELKKYEPAYVKVTSRVDDAMHLPVEVTAEAKLDY